MQRFVVMLGGRCNANEAKKRAQDGLEIRHDAGWLAGWLAGLILLRSWVGIAIAEEEEEDSQAIYQQHFGLNGKQHFGLGMRIFCLPSCRCFFRAVAK